MENPMIQVIIPVSLLLLIVLWKKMPYVGGNINAALLTAGALTLLLGGIWNPGEWVAAWVDGLNRLAWIICLSITGAIFAEISTRLGITRELWCSASCFPWALRAPF